MSLRILSRAREPFQPLAGLRRGDEVALALVQPQRLGGRCPGLGAAAEEALGLYERKGNLVAAARAHQWLERLPGP